MKLSHLHESPSLELFHATSARFKQFLPRPTWFSTNKRDAEGWHSGGAESGNESTTYTAKYTGGRIATWEEAAEIAKEVWPEDEIMYSMFDENVGEWDEDEVRDFISRLKKKGFDASYIEDYDPVDFNAGNTQSLCVFDPSKHVTITGTLQIGKPKPKSLTLDDYEVDQRVEFKDDAVRPWRGTIIKKLPKGSKLGFHHPRSDKDIPGGSSYTQEALDYWDHLMVNNLMDMTTEESSPPEKIALMPLMGFAPIKIVK